MSKKIWGTIVSSAIIIGGGAGGVFWIHQQAVDELAIAPKLAVASSKEVDKSTVANTSNPSNKKTRKQIIEDSQKKVVTIESSDGLGSGFLYNNKGDVITNAHVVEGSQKVTVRTLDHQEYQGTVIGIGEETDVAVVRVPDLVKMEPLTISSAKAEVGDEILALGSPLGFENTVTTGIISGLDRSFEIEPYIYTNLYQISAPITNGNSGGPLINAETGEVLGINSTVVKQEGGLGFSIPITSVLKQVQQWSERSSDGKSAQTIRDNSSQTSSAELSEAEGLVADFYSYLSMNDYVAAYALLGSDWQSSTSYAKFREGYTYTSYVSLEKISSKRKAEDELEVSAVIAAEERKDGEYITSRYNVTYQVGYENGQIKILHGQGKKIQ
ncbi:trypsin-like peptidase domain-containing protein [Paenibacillus barcinonensis]|uniref:Trypsin-like peptidase n=1 Tax=Paenibacillus barcinonensis TaxID=198119 RepID=A0A2V4V5H4_PAEBA|nr:trypsin-like peptidase domain-containing protein [Paenibacillus barcinonensis]PYE47687.1 trypsin-like peptidase [Paenibacillus barcinonensis]QKS58553.1 trypsin-like peptidase domain-containing protein [Paenibacillus barcinonensis]